MKHLLSVNDLNTKEIAKILTRANHYAVTNRKSNKKQKKLTGRTLINLFVETSTRTLTSFELAAKRLDVDVITMNVDKSAITVKGESLVDTAMTLNAMHPDFIVIRHNVSGQVKELATYMDCSVINAGDGTNEHPTQALVDAAAIKNSFGKIEGLNIAICGDIIHSRVARSNLLMFRRLGANLRVIAPKAFLPTDNSLKEKNIEVFTDMQKGLENVDIIMMLRVQKERMQNSEIPSEKEFHKNYGLTAEKLRYAKPTAKVMHPGPINRGVEIDSEIADDPKRSLILQQVEIGVPVRQAILEFLANG